MLLVLTCAVFLLVVMPAALLWLGRGIEAGTDGRSRIAAVRVQRAMVQEANDPDRVSWYGRPMKPAFTRYQRPAPKTAMHHDATVSTSRQPAPNRDALASETAGNGMPSKKSWLYRPLRPVFGPPLTGQPPEV